MRLSWSERSEGLWRGDCGPVTNRYVPPGPGAALPGQNGAYNGCIRMYELLLAVAGVAGGAIAAVSGFGIGSVLTPVLAMAVDTKVAVAAVSLPHLVGTAVRFWHLGGRPDGWVLWRFGLTSAAGGLAGALLHGRLGSPALSYVFGALLVFVSAGQLTGVAARLHFGGRSAWAAGALSGFFGGLVGNQGGIRSAALLEFDLEKRTFVATATAIGLMVDAARVPAYLWSVGGELPRLAGWMGVATAGVVVGTFLGGAVLSRLPDRAFRPVVALLIGALGLLMIARA